MQETMQETSQTQLQFWNIPTDEFNKMALPHYDLRALFVKHAITVKVPLVNLEDHPQQRQLVPSAVTRLTAAFFNTGIDRSHNPGLGLMQQGPWTINNSGGGLELCSAEPCVLVLSGKHRIAALKEWLLQNPDQAEGQSYWSFKLLPPGMAGVDC